MAVELNHTIVSARDAETAARWVAELLGLPEPVPASHFWVVETANGVSLDFDDAERIISQHYAFLVSDDDFDTIFGRIAERGIPHWADPGQSQGGQINHRFGGRGVYFENPDGHLLEILTQPYGSGPT